MLPRLQRNPSPSPNCSTSHSQTTPKLSDPPATITNEKEPPPEGHLHRTRDATPCPAPVRPGDTLRARYRVASARESRSRPEWGIVQGLATAENRKGVTVMTMSVMNFFTRQFPADGGDALRPRGPGAAS